MKKKKKKKKKEIKKGFLFQDLKISPPNHKIKKIKKKKFSIFHNKETKEQKISWKYEILFKHKEKLFYKLVK